MGIPPAVARASCLCTSRERDTHATTAFPRGIHNS